MDQNIGLVLKTSGYPDQVALSGCHGNQSKLQNFHIQKIPNFAIIKIQYIIIKIFAPTRYL